MLMPGRRGALVSGGWAQGGSGGSGVPQSLTLESRDATVGEYKASQEITFEPGFHSPAGDAFLAEITQGSGGTGGSGGFSTAAGGYRYGFNGKENDNEIKGEGAQQDYGMRIYDPRLGKFLSVDPLQASFSDLSSYQYAGNTPIQAVDLDGLEPRGFKEYWDEKTSPYLTKWGYTVQDIYDYETKRVWTVMHYPNTKEFFYYETKYEGAQRLFKPYNTSLNKDIDRNWTGLFKQFIPRSKSELTEQIVNTVESSVFITGLIITGGILVDGALTTFGTEATKKFILETVKDEIKDQLVEKVVGIDLPINPAEFMKSQSERMVKKLGKKIGEGRLSYKKGRDGAFEALKDIEATLLNADEVTDVISKTHLRGSNDIMDVYSKKTDKTVRLRVQEDGSYEFDTLIDGKSSKFKPKQ